MTTIYDWLTVAVFSALAVLYLQRSVEEEVHDSVWHYLPPAVGCAASNWLGNNGYAFFALAILAGCVTYIWKVLRPTLPTRW